ncbi:hypothetical protein ACLOJK_029043 [Asimina triloba]
MIITMDLSFQKIPTLVELCVQTAIDNIRYLGDVGETDIYLLKDILPHCTLDQLMHIEDSSKAKGKERDEAQKKSVDRLKKLYEAEGASESGCSNVKGNLMKKAKMEYLNSQGTSGHEEKGIRKEILFTLKLKCFSDYEAKQLSWKESGIQFESKQAIWKMIAPMIVVLGKTVLICSFLTLLSFLSISIVGGENGGLQGDGVVDATLVHWVDCTNCEDVPGESPSNMHVIAWRHVLANSYVIAMRASASIVSVHVVEVALKIGKNWMQNHGYISELGKPSPSPPFLHLLHWLQISTRVGD